eukprot:COSAG06_NODE_10887_length_1601_cov_1.316911_2_plen_35_part_01
MVALGLSGEVCWAVDLLYSAQLTACAARGRGGRHR